MGREEVEQIPASSQLRYYKELVVDTKDVVQSNDIVVAPQFPEDVDFLLQLGDVLGVVPEHDALAGKLLSLSGPSASRHVSLGLSAGGDADLSVGSFPNDQIAVEQVGGTSLRLFRRWG